MAISRKLSFCAVTRRPPASSSSSPAALRLRDTPVDHNSTAKSSAIIVAAIPPLSFRNDREVRAAAFQEQFSLPKFAYSSFQVMSIHLGLKINMNTHAMLHGGLLFQYIDVRRWCWLYDNEKALSNRLLVQ